MRRAALRPMPVSRYRTRTIAGRLRLQRGNRRAAAMYCADVSLIEKPPFGPAARRCGRRHATLMPLEVLHGALVLLGGGAGLEGAEIAAPAGLRIDLARIETVAAGRKLADHVILLKSSWRSLNVAHRR